MHAVGQGAHQVAHVAVGLVQAPLLELLHHHAALHLQAPRTEGQLQHTVGLQPEACLGIGARHGEVVVGDVVVGPRVVLPARLLQGGVIVGDMHRPAEHQVLEQMGETGMVRMLVARADIIDDVQRHHLRGGVFVVHQPQAVVQYVLVNLQGQ